MASAAQPLFRITSQQIWDCTAVRGRNDLLSWERENKTKPEEIVNSLNINLGNKTTLPLTLLCRSSLRPVLFLVALSCCSLLSVGRAVSPPPDGGYPNGNTAEGDFALNDLTSGQGNVAVGASALFNNVAGSGNTAIGGDALLNNTTDGNTAIGSEALFSNTDGSDNVATGSQALRANTSGDANTATGFEALLKNTTGNFNTATGFAASASNSSGSQNYAGGVVALESNTSGHDNTAVGFDALGDNTTGSNNIAVGSSAGLNLTKGNNNIDIGNAGVVGESKVIRIGTKGTHLQTFIAGISGVAASGSTVVVNSSGKLGVATSSARFKEAIKPIDKASEAILALKPVSFRYKEEIDPDGIPQFGLVAEQVEKVNPDLVARDEQGKPYTVRYEAVNAMLLNEFLKEHRTVEEQKSTITELKSAVAEQRKQIESLTTAVEKVSARVESTPPAASLMVINREK